jgi:hypothetical protein
MVSQTTLEVRCELGFVLPSMVGGVFDLELRLDGALSSSFLHGKVVRVRAVDHVLVIALTTLPELLVALIASPRGAARLPPVEVMVVDRDRVRRTHVASAFRAEGCHVFETATPLEAIDELVDATRTTDVIAVADTAPDHNGVDLRDYLDGAYVDALIVTVDDLGWTPSRAEVDPTASEQLLRSAVRSVLGHRTDRA